LLKEIRGPGRIEEAFNRTLVAVSRASQGEQIPWFSSSLVEDFSFATAARAAPTRAARGRGREKAAIPPPVSRKKAAPAPIRTPTPAASTNPRTRRHRRKLGGFRRQISVRSLRRHGA
jgi:hypothetical protein